MATIDDFHKLDIRVGKVLEVEDFPEAKNSPSFKLTIDFGPEIGVKHSSVGIATLYKKKDLKGKLVLGVVNFPPRQIAGFLSEVLTLGVPDKNGNCMLVEPEFKDALIGGKLY